MLIVRTRLLVGTAVLRRLAFPVVLLVLAAFAPACGTGTALPDPGKAELLWDSWRVPHIYPGDDATTWLSRHAEARTVHPWRVGQLSPGGESTPTSDS